MRIERFGLWGWALVLALLPAIAQAQVYEAGCRSKIRRLPDVVQYANTNGPRPYKIKIEQGLGGLTYHEMRVATHRAASVWNEQANAGFFYYTGDWDGGDLPNAYANCVAFGIDFDLIVFESGNAPITGQLGSEEPKCVDANGVAHHHQIRVYKRDKNHTLAPFAVGKAGPEQIDLVYHLAHELGHTLGLDHPGQGLQLPAGYSDFEFGVMKTHAGRFGDDRRRDLYAWDQRCATKIAGRRNLRAWAMVHDEFGFGEPFVWSGSWRVNKGAIGRTGAGNFAWAGLRQLQAYNSFFRLFVTENLTTEDSTEISFDPSDDFLSVAPTLSVWREDPNVERVLYVDWEDAPVRFAEDSEHRARHTWSRDGWATYTDAELEYCRVVFGRICAVSFSIQTGHRLATTWNEYWQKTLVAWVHQSRGSEPISRAVRISAGHHETLYNPDEQVLAPPFLTNLHSAVSPGLACGPYSGTYNCVIAYVDDHATDGTITVRRFSSSSGIFDFEEGVYAIPETTFGEIAAWHDTREFHVAFRDVEGFLQVWHSVGGDDWAFVGRFQRTASGPSAVSYYNDRSTYVVTYW